MRAKQPRTIFYRLQQDFLEKKTLFFLASLLTLIQVILTLYLPVLIGQSIDHLLDKGEAHRLILLIGQMLVVILLNVIIQWVNPILYTRLVYEYIFRLREKVMKKIHELPLSQLDQHSIGDMVSRVTTDIEQLANGLLMIFNQFLVGFLTIIMTVIMMANIDFLMMGMTIVLTPLSLYLARFIANRSYVFFGQQTQKRGQQTQLIDESISQEDLIHSLGAQEDFIRRFKKTNEQYAQASKQAIFYSSTVNPSTRFINALIYLLLTGVGALRIMSGDLSVGQLTTFLNYVNQYTKPFNDISSVLSEMQSALACADRLYSILDLPSMVESVEHSTFRMQLGQVSFDRVTFGYDKEKPLIKNLSLDIPAGAKVAIVGPTGAGKSTLINLLMRFYDVDNGQILIDNTPLEEIHREILYQDMGMVLQETWLKTATIHDNIAYGTKNASRSDVIKAAKAANADFFIQQLPDGYDTFLEDGGQSLSQGQRQLINIARVFLKSLKFLILDEATSSIDTRTELLVQSAFERLMEGKTSFIIAHRLSTIEHADLILVMVDGDIVEHGSHSELMDRKGVYYGLQTANIKN